MIRDRPVDGFPQVVDAPRRIAIFRALYLGDFLLAVPALRSIRAGFPSAEITLIGLPWTGDLIPRFDRYIDRFVEFPGYPGLSEIDVDAGRTALFLDKQRAYDYDLVVQMQGSGATSNPFALALGGRVTAGYFEGKRSPGLVLATPYPHHLPEVLRNVHLARLIGCPPTDLRLEFPLLECDRAEAQALVPDLGQSDRPVIGLHPGAKRPAQRWPVKSFATVADTLARDWNADIILTGSAEEEPIVRAVAHEMRRQPAILAGKTSLGGLAAVVDELDLFISNDTGPAHLAEALGTRSIRIFGPADVARWAPLDRMRHAVSHHPVACSPCGFWECPIDHRCLGRIDPQSVVTSAAGLLSPGMATCSA